MNGGSDLLSDDLLGHTRYASVNKLGGNSCISVKEFMKYKDFEFGPVLGRGLCQALALQKVRL